MDGGGTDAALYLKGSLGFYAGTETEARNKFRNDGHIMELRHTADDFVYTILSIWAPKIPSPTPAELPDREATLTLAREVSDSPNDREYLDLYNNGYDLSGYQYGIRIQKRGTGSYRDFAFDKHDGSNPIVNLLVVKTESGNVGIGDKATPAAKLDVFGGDVYVSSAGNGVIFKSPDGSICTKLSIDNSGNPVWTTVGGTLNKQVEVYSPQTNTWRTEVSIPSPRLFAAAGVLDDTLYVVGGYPALAVNEAFSPFLPVSIDIKPGDAGNTINLRARGTVQAAILSSPAFDASSVNPDTVTLSGAGVSTTGRGTPWTTFRDVDRDGRLDLIVQFSIRDLELDPAATEAVLKATTFSGQRIRGVDSVRFVP